jgi:FkbH-like protein
MKIAFTSNYTIDLVAERVEAVLTANDAKLQKYVAPFNQYYQELATPDSELATFSPNFTILALDHYDHIEEPEQIAALLRKAHETLPSCIFLVHNAVPFHPQLLTFTNWNQPDSTEARYARFNLELAQRLDEVPNTYMLDLAAEIRHLGAAAAFDPRLSYLAKIPFSDEGVRRIGDQVAEAVSTLGGRRSKCIVLDLDNTLWGGILGEVGPEHIQLDTDGPGKAFYDFQTMLVNLCQSGILLSICSKNDEDLVMETLKSHPAMVIKPEHLSAVRINWAPKSENIRSLAEELDIGLDTFLFLDDSPHEREEVRRALPAVTVPEMPNDFASYPSFLAALPTLNTFHVTDTDRKRYVRYFHERQRRQAKTEEGSLEDYLASLGTKLTVQAATDHAIPRVAQLTQRTNQFNLTTKRYTEATIREKTESDKWMILTASSEDRFGDSGIVGAAIVALRDNDAELDTFLMSCRVLGRGVEDAFFHAVAYCCRQKGRKRLVAQYIPTERNRRAAAFLAEQGALKREHDYLLDLDQLPLPPGHVEIRYEEV